MGKKDKLKKNPLVTVCTPTFNRRPFIPMMIKCFEHQTYPKDKIEWIIIDDGTDKIEDLVTHIPQVKYLKFDEKLTIGKKRNIGNDKAQGEIIVYMDDDDYYPPERISHAVERLQSNPQALCAGGSEIYIFFKHIQKMVQFGPYGPNHATAGTFAFRRELLDISRYNENAAIAEEKEFLKNYTIPFVQLDPLKSILVFSHEQNTFDKRKLLEMDFPNQYQKYSDKTVDMFIRGGEKEASIKKYFLEDIGSLLAVYEPGNATYKPDVMQQMKIIEEERKKMMQQMQSQQGDGKIMIQNTGEEPRELNAQEILTLLQTQQQQIQILTQRNTELENILSQFQQTKF